jgi:threonine dehydrogenase-like Zn-dependent dehydrogenase
VRVAVFQGPGTPFKIEQVPDPRPGPRDVIVRVARCGICGSDLSMTSGSPFDVPPGQRMGHEFSGEVVECGSAVDGLKVGDRVACKPSIGCGTCDACRRGQTVFCSSLRLVFGGFGDYVGIDQRCAIPLPVGLSMADGAIVEPMAVALHALHMAGLRSGEHVLVLGAGSMALAVVYWARRLGAARITVVSRSDRRRDIAHAMGADFFYSIDEEQPVVAGFGVTPPGIAAECVGAPGMLEQAIQLVRPGGTVVSLGMCSHREPITAAACAFKELRVLFPIGSTLREFEETARTLDRGHVQPEVMVSEVIGLDELPAKIEALRIGTQNLKVHVEPARDAG